MRSWLSVVLLAAAACGTDQRPPEENDPTPVTPDVCASSYVDYENFTAPFVINWCRGCHSSSIPAGQRQKAPMGVNFDTPEDIHHWADRINVLAATTDAPTMPPAGGPSDEERTMLREWIECGMR